MKTNKITYQYIETDDETATITGLSFADVIELINEHNEYMQTNYKNIAEFNAGELYRHIQTEKQIF